LSLGADIIIVGSWLNGRAFQNLQHLFYCFPDFEQSMKRI
jgi:hypothetical protein